MIATLLLTEVFGTGGGVIVPPTGIIARFLAVFPAFAAVPTVTIQYWLDRALLTTGSWGDEHPTFLLTAHYLTLNGLGTGAEAELAATGSLGFKSIRSGALSLDRGDNAAATGFDATAYGRQFKPFLMVFSGGPLITGTGTVAGGYSGFAPWPF